MKKILSILAAAVLSCAAIYAQMPGRTAYFLDGYDFRHQMNPALPSARSYFIIPALGFVNVGVQSNVGFDTFFYPSENGKLVSFMHESVDYNTFSKGLQKTNRISADVSTSIISVGAWGKKGGFTTVEINTKINTAVTLPKDMFTVLKNLGGQPHYDFGDIAARARAYLEIAVGHSRKVLDNLTVGAKVKFLLGLADVNVGIDKMTLDMTSEKWEITSKGSMKIACGMIDINTDADNKVDFKSIKPNFSGNVSSYIGGYGAALDLGASYNFKALGLTVSAAVLDLGFISWKNPICASTKDNVWSFDGFNDISITGGGSSLGDQFNEKLQEFGDNVFSFYKDGSQKKSTEMMAATVTAGAEYVMPFFKPMSVSALFTSRIQKTSGWAEGRIGVNFGFFNTIGISVSYGLSTFGSSLGAALNLHCRALSFYVAMDSVPFKWTMPMQFSQKFKMGLPLGHLNFNINTGLVFNVSKRKDK